MAAEDTMTSTLVSSNLWYMWTVMQQRILY